ncbi:MAG: 2-C-methyl-D-erythritol 4-phosphate cytidylyltransferase [Tannerella sp.]|jgi:2-C-methyl-D-erythritol 4-phosphate cytidylyltransferase|nr:2-C-methyl-D-erythritol 4-phosphate cytidylyltransferase [Tannerella sp.]
MKRSVIIVAGGKGARMGGDLPKQFLPLNGKPVLMHTLDVFYRWDSSAGILLVIPEEHESYWSMLCREIGCKIPHRIIYGGETRFHSVQNAIRELDGDCIAAVHDGVRPFVGCDVISACFAIAEEYGAAIPVVAMTESVRMIDGGQSRPLDRNRICTVQTPQVFRAELLRQAYGRSYDAQFTDDASLVEAAGYAVRLVDGNRENIKITTPMDLRYAEIMMT